MVNYNKGLAKYTNICYHILINNLKGGSFLAIEKQYQTELLYDEEYYTKAAEAAMFAYGSPITFDKLAQAIGADVRDVPKILMAMMPKYKNSAIEVLILGDCAQLVTKNEYADIVRNTLEIRKNQPLSRAALEVLAIIAYNQPATRALVDKVRGIESPSVIMSLCDKGLIEEKGRLDAPGRPVLYGTTPVFLRTFGLESLEQLNEHPDLLEFSQQIAQKKESLLISEKKEEPSNTGSPHQLELEKGMLETGKITAEVLAIKQDELLMSEYD